MQLLVVSPYVPYPLHGGASVRMFNILEGLADLGHELHLVSGAKGGTDPQATPLAEFCRSTRTFPIREPTSLRWVQGTFSFRPYPAHRFATDGYRSVLAECLEETEPDIVWANFLFMAGPAAELAPADVPVVLDQHEAEVHHWRGYLTSGAIHERIFAGLTLAKLQWFEPRILDQLDAAVAVAESEADHLRTQGPEELPVWVLPNGADLCRADALGPVTDQESIVFVGGMGVQRNADAAAWFAEEIFPKIRDVRPEAQFTIVGSDPLPTVQQLSRISGVEISGTVPNVEPFYRDARVVVVPQRQGAGTKLKVLEALAHQRPLVTTPNGAQGIALKDGEHALIREEPEEFASAVASLLSDPERGRALAKKGRGLVEDRYAWSAIVDDLDERLRRLVKQDDSAENG